jgi:integrase
MSRRGFGHTRKLPSGRTQASYIGPDNVRHTAPTTFRLKSEAESWLSKEHDRIAAGGWTPTAKRAEPVATVTVAEYAEAWLAETRASKDWSERYYVLNRGQVRRFITPDDELGAIPLGELSAERVDVWHAKLCPDAPTQRAQVYSLLGQIMAKAAARGRIAANPCQIKGAGQSPKRKAPVVLISLDEANADDETLMRRLVDALPDRLALLPQLGFWLGVRFGEATELRRKDVDLVAGTVSVTRGVTWVLGEPGTPGRFHVGPPKSDAGVRTLDIPPHLLPALREHLRAHARFGGGEALLFPSAGDPQRHLMQTTFNKQWRKITAAAGRPGLKFHYLRHSHANAYTELGATTAEVMARLGHSTPSMAQHYQHATQRRATVLARRLSGLPDTDAAIG